MLSSSHASYITLSVGQNTDVVLSSKWQLQLTKSGDYQLNIFSQLKVLVKIESVSGRSILCTLQCASVIISEPSLAILVSAVLLLSYRHTEAHDRYTHDATTVGESN